MRKDNKGMTLIELLVAIAMLGVVISPFLKTFTISARQNNKARETFRATTVAQNLMEGLEAFSLEDVCIQVNNDVTKSKLYMPYGYNAHMELENSSGEKSGERINGEYVFKNTNSNQYELGIQGIEEDEKIYDAKILLDASDYDTVNHSVGVSVDFMNEDTDFIYSLKQEHDEAIVDNNSERWANTKRTFYISVKKENDKKPVQVGVKVTYEYPKQNGQATEKVTSDYVKETTLVDLNNLYIFYYPNYSSDTEDNILDVFDIDFQADVDFNLYLVKKRYPGASSEDTNYHAFLNVKDSPSNEKKPRITLRTNILDDIYRHSDITSNSISYAYKYNGPLTQEEIPYMLNFVEDVPQDLSGKSDRKNLIYKTTVEVYPEGTYPDLFDTTEPIAKLSNE